jgi:hypothetical protein
VLVLAGFLLLSLIFVSFQAAAHPDQDAVKDNAPLNPNFDGLVNALDKSDGANQNGWNQQAVHNPTCGGHPDR